MLEYRKIDGLYQLVDTDNNTVIYEGKEVGICYDKEFGTLLRHSSPACVRNFFMKSFNAYMENGLNDIAYKLEMIISDKWDVEELNKIIDITGYILRTKLPDTNQSAHKPQN